MDSKVRYWSANANKMLTYHGNSFRNDEFFIFNFQKYVYIPTYYSRWREFYANFYISPAKLNADEYSKISRVKLLKNPSHEKKYHDKIKKFQI